MKVIVIGASGTIGKAVVKELSNSHEVIKVGSKSGDYQVDMTSTDSIKQLYKSIGNFDALVCAAGNLRFKKFNTMTAEDYLFGLQHKLMGQVNLVRLGMEYINRNGSFTLTSGILNHDPIVTGSSASMVNGALEGFVIAAAIEMPDKLRINCVSPTVINESMPMYADYFPGFQPVAAAVAALAYRKSVDGGQTGKVYKAGY